MRSILMERGSDVVVSGFVCCGSDVVVSGFVFGGSDVVISGFVCVAVLKLSYQDSCVAVLTLSYQDSCVAVGRVHGMLHTACRPWRRSRGGRFSIVRVRRFPNHPTPRYLLD